MPISDTIRRLLRYRMCLEKFKRFGWDTTFSYTIAKESGLSSEQIRKDFSKFKISGHKKGGYNIDEILEKINEIFEKHVTDHIIIVGSGNIGEALIKYTGFEKHNIKIAALFDIDPVKLKRKYNVPIYRMDMLQEVITMYKVSTAVLAVPAIAAQEVCHELVNCGITGIMNFSPVILKTPESVNVYNIEMIPVLEALIYHSNNKS
jgi:redox-sensing transcriptional repressor